MRNPQDTPGNGPGSLFGRVRTVALRRRAGCKPLSRPGFRRFANAPEGCHSLRPSARGYHTSRIVELMHFPRLRSHCCREKILFYNNDLCKSCL